MPLFPPLGAGIGRAASQHCGGFEGSVTQQRVFLMQLLEIVIQQQAELQPCARRCESFTEAFSSTNEGSI